MGFVAFLNVLFAIVEFYCGRKFHSTALSSDAIHDFGDGLSIVLSWFFEKVSTLTPDKDYPFGYRRFSMLGALISSLFIMIGSIVMIIVALVSLKDPWPVNSKGVFGGSCHC